MTKNKKTNWVNAPTDQEIPRYAGFVYEIVNLLNNRRYIGKKSFWTTRRKKIAGRKYRKKEITRSNWRSYKSSSRELKSDIEQLGDHHFTFTILRLCHTKDEMARHEAILQLSNDVLNRRLPNGTYMYYNKNIYYKGIRR